MADEDRPKSHSDEADAGRLPVPGADRQRAYRRSRATKSIDLSGRTHELLRELCDRDGIGLDAAVQSAVLAALGPNRADRDIMEAAWIYLEAARAAIAQLDREGILTARLMQAVQDASDAFNATAESAGDLSSKAGGRARWLIDQGQARVNRIGSESMPAGPLAADARHGTVADIAQTLVAGGSGIGLHNASLVLLPDTDDDPGEHIVRVRAPRGDAR